MSRLRAIPLVLALCFVAGLALAACGGDEDADLLPGETASEINANLELVEELVADGECVGAANAAAAVSEQVESLSGVEPELKEALSKGAARLNEVIVECEEAPAEEETVPSVDPEEQEREAEERADQAKSDRADEKRQEQEDKPEKVTPPTEAPDQEEDEGEEAEVPPSEPSDGGTPSGGLSPAAPAEDE